MKVWLCQCQVCGETFYDSVYEAYPIQKGHCRFCNQNHLKKVLPESEYDKLQWKDMVAFNRSIYREFEKNPYYDEQLCYQRRLRDWSEDKHSDCYFEEELIERSRELSLWETWFKSKERKALEEKYPEDITPEEAPKPYIDTLEPYETDDEEEEEEEEIEAPEPKYIPRCPTCGSPDVVYGIMSRGWGPPVQYRCRNCGYEW